MLRIPKGQTDAQLRALLEPYKDAQLLHLSTAEGAFGRFEDREQGQRFQVRFAVGENSALGLRMGFCWPFEDRQQRFQVRLLGAP